MVQPNARPWETRPTPLRLADKCPSYRQKGGLPSIKDLICYAGAERGVVSSDFLCQASDYHNKLGWLDRLRNMHLIAF